MNLFEDSSKISRIDFHVRMAVILACLIGYAVLFVAGVYNLWFIPLILSFVIYGYFDFFSKEPPFFSDAIWTIITLGIVAVPITLSFMGRLFFLDALDFIFLFLPLIKLMTTRTGRDYLQIYALAFGQVLYGTIVNLDISFGIALLAYIILTMWGLIVLSFKTAISKADDQAYLTEDAEKAVFKRPYLVFVAVLPFVAVLLTSLLFFIIPRPGSALTSFSFGVGKRQSGFSDQVYIGDVGDIKLDHSVAMRVEVSGPPLESPIYWKGAVLDYFSGMQWSMNNNLPPNELKNFRRGVFSFTNQDRRLLTKQRIFLDDMSAKYIFHGGFAGWVKARTHMIQVYANGSIVLPEGRSFLQYYEVWSSDENTIVVPDSVLPYFLQLPEDLDPRVVTLAREITKGAGTPLKAALRMEEYLRTQFSYSLQAGLKPTTKPLSEFLFVRKSGHCEYFATSMAIMLRTLGIHSRLVTGYQQGEYNESEGYFLVRQSDAHAWVEAYINKKWIRFDPTPSAGLAGHEPSLLGEIQKYFDALAFKWQRYVVAYSVRDQIEILLEADAKLRMTSPSDVKIWFRNHQQDFSTAFVVIFVVIMFVKRKSIYTALTKGKVKKQKHHQLSSSYRTMCKMLGKAGLEINDSTTARELVMSAELKFPAARQALLMWLDKFEPLRYRPGQLQDRDFNELKQYELEVKRHLKL